MMPNGSVINRTVINGTGAGLAGSVPLHAGAIDGGAAAKGGAIDWATIKVGVA